MLIRTPELDPATLSRLEELEGLRRELGGRGLDPGRWVGSLRRSLRARTAEGSISIEGFHVGDEEALALAGQDAGVEPEGEDQRALAAYVRAMDHVGVMAADPEFEWSRRALLDLHFDACGFQRDGGPGRWRSGSVRIVSSDGGVAYEAPSADDVPALMHEVVAWLREGDMDRPAVVRAAMAHLHVISVHPFRDGNGRVARIVQSLVLARAGPVAPELGSIEEYLAENTAAYYAALNEAHGSAYRPGESDARGWMAFCVDAHLTQARRRIEQIDAAARRWERIEALLAERDWPDRFAIALEQALVGGTDRGSYAGEANVSDPTASGDLRRLLDAGMLLREGRSRSTRYRASESLRDLAT